jgi:hypothetical protein
MKEKGHQNIDQLTALRIASPIEMLPVAAAANCAANTANIRETNDCTFVVKLINAGKISKDG